MDASDNVSVEKLEKAVATVTQEKIQSGGESAQGFILLPEVQAMLLNSKLATGSDSTTNHTLSEYSPASHIDLPQEILEQIFGLLRPSDPLQLPPVLTEHAWVLGRVCSDWRRLSRAMPVLWTTSIVVDSTVKKPLMQLKCAEDILPEVAFISLWLCDVMPGIPMMDLLPYLPHINQLTWDFEYGWQLREVMNGFPPGSLSQLEILMITVGHMDSEVDNKPEKNTGLFGRSSRLRYLTLQSDIPVFLLSDIPWSQLHSFSLLPTYPYQISAVTQSHWMELGRQNPFPHMSSLRSLTLEMTVEYFDFILSLDFPWHQVVSLTSHESAAKLRIPVQAQDSYFHGTGARSNPPL
ncbi:hypothetical protein C0995_006224 [Termitomyces sp. Mi166|nr:hypothetical protein C0995_006224 [Termitomyces sp. Mi166\